MRSEKHPDIFFENMKKKPALQKILDNFSDYDEESIESLDQPRWIRKHLLRMYNDSTVQQKSSNAALIASEMTKNSNKPIEEKYETRIWNNGTWIPKVTDGFSIDTNDGDILLIHHHNNVQNDSTIMKLTPQSMTEMMNGSTIYKMMTILEYKISLRERMNDKYKGEQFEDISGSTLSGTLGQYGVRIGK